MKSKARLILGVIFGSMMGLAYGLVSQYINSIFLPGIPMYDPAPGKFVSTLLAMLAGGFLGFLAAWPEEFLLGVLISSAAGTLISSLISLQSQAGNSEQTAGTAALLFITFLPRVFFFLPIALLARWVVHLWEQETLYNTYSIRKRLGSVLLIIVVGVAIGAFSLYSANTRAAVKDMNQLILAGRQASRTSSLPQPLQRVKGFLENSNAPYTLKLVSGPTAIPIPRATYGFSEDETDIEVNFANGYRFGCVYIPGDKQPNCIDY